jgi:hypothetical protein
MNSKTWIALLSFALALSLRADESLPQRYLDIYLQINQAEQLQRHNDDKGALATFQDCYQRLLAIRATDPYWESCLVDHRLNDARAKIVELGPKVYPQATAPAQLAPAVVPATNLPANLPPAVQAFQEALPRLEAEQASPPMAPQVKSFFDENPPQEAVGRRFNNSYPWKNNITATKFWIGESGAAASAWDPHWAHDNGGADNPLERSGYATGQHASSLNPFYVALPFNDLTHPDLAQKWLPRGWQREPKDGKPISSCKDRWIEIKNGRGDDCFAQWEDVGPRATDEAAYVFGNEGPGQDNPPGLCISPAVADYLRLTGDATTPVSWRFVDDQNVRPGAWLKLDEQAVIYRALHHASL